MGQTDLFPLRRKARRGSLLPKNPTASAGCEPANLGTKGQHATSRPPKPQELTITVPAEKKFEMNLEELTSLLQSLALLLTYLHDVNTHNV